VKLDGETVKSKRVNAGASVRYEVSKVGYTTQSGTIETKSSDAGKTVDKRIVLVAVSG
jgi:hypothetical protein